MRPAHLGPVDSSSFGGEAVVADLDGGHRDDLAEVGRIGDDFLIAGHGGVEHAFAGDRGVGAEGATAENTAVFEGEDSRFERGH